MFIKVYKYGEKVIKINGHYCPTSREDYLKKFLDMRDNYSNELPDVDVRALDAFDKDGRPTFRCNYKCLGNYIIGLCLRLEAVVDKKLVTDRALIEKINQFRNHDFRFSHGEFTTQEEIDMINSILNDVIEYLQKNKAP